MSKLLIALSLLVLITAVSAERHRHNKGKHANKPDKATRSCKRYDCPKFESANRTKEYEQRVYAKANWVQYKTKGTNLRFIMQRSFPPLHHYINGRNNESKTMKLPLPVMIKLQGINMTTMPIQSSCHFYLPDSYGSLPQPTDKDVTLVQTPEKMTVYVHVLRAFRHTLEDVRKERDHLWESLDDHGLAYDKEAVFLVSYNKPTHPRRRYYHNEIWVAAM